MTSTPFRNSIKQKYEEFALDLINKVSVDQIKYYLKNYQIKGTTVFKIRDSDYLPLIFIGHKISGCFDFKKILNFYPLIYLISNFIEINGNENQEFKFIVTNMFSIVMQNAMATLNIPDCKINYNKLIRILLYHMTVEKIERIGNDKLLIFFVLFNDLYNLVEKEFFLAAFGVHPKVNNNNNNNNNRSRNDYDFLNEYIVS